MPRTGVTAEDVANAARHLEKAGLPPTIRNIRDRLGKGSLSTIAAHKRAFEADRQNGPGPALPDPIAEQLLKGAEAYWKELVDAASQEIEAVRKQAEADIGKREKQLDDADKELTTLMEKIGDQSDQIASLEAIGKAQTQTIADRDKTLHDKAVELSRVIAERDAAQTHTTSLENQLKAAHQSVATAQGDTVQLQERLDGQAMEFAKEKTALQKQFNEYKDRLVTMSDDHRKAANGQREAEKSAAAAHAQAAAATKETTRLQRELQDAQDEARLLTEKLGEARGERDAIGRQTEEQRIQLNKTQASLAEAQQLVRQYVHKDKSLVQELLEERRGGAYS